MDDNFEGQQAGNDPFAQPADVQPDEETSSDPSFFRGAATLCSVTAAGGAVIYLSVWLSSKGDHGSTINWLRDQGTMASLGLLAISFLFGIVALVGVAKHGAQTILLRACTGLALGVAFFGVFVYGFVRHVAQIQAVYARETNPSIAPAKISHPSAPLTDGECEAFGHDLDKHFEAGDSQYFVTMLDLSGLLDRLAPDDSALHSQLQANYAAFEKGFVTSLSAGVKRIESFKCLRVKHVDGEARLLCRVVNNIGGLTYSELILGRAAGGVRIVDMYYYTTGETVSQTVNRLYILPAIEGHKSLLDRLFGPKSDFIRTYPQWSEMVRNAAEGQNQKALDAYKTLPASVQKEKLILLTELQAAIHSDPEAYRQGLELWRSTYPNDPATDLLSMPVLADKKQFQEALACAERLNTVIGGDAYLDSVRAQFNLKLGNAAKAKDLLTHAMEAEPTLIEPYLWLVRTLSDEQQFAAAVAVLDKMCAAKNMHHSTVAPILERSPEHASLVKTPNSTK